MRILFAVLFVLAGCQGERKVISAMSVKWQVWYTAGTWELIDASPNAKLTERGCMVDHGRVIACSVRRIIQHPVKDY